MVEEQEIYIQTMESLFARLDQRDAQGIYDLFAPSVQSEELEAQIQELLSVYPGPTEILGPVPPLQGENSFESGERASAVCGTFPLFSNGQYYWCYFELMYENTVDENQIGITEMHFFTDAAYYEVWSGDDCWAEEKGLNLHIKDVEEYNIICINTYPYDYHPGKTVALEDAKRFFETSTSMADFINQFGEPASTDHFGSVYPMEKENGEERYLYIAHEDDQIRYCDILGTFSYVDSVLKEQ